MLDKISIIFSLMEVRFVLSILIIGALVDVFKRVVSGTRIFRKSCEDINLDSVATIYHGNIQTGRYTNGLKQFRKDIYLHNDHKEI